mmetsp:Transcript_52201/g.138304  ORF Transcript_52201/g.138304 Transcript_52201/m.138304 type:complete len:261 (-) Transcript_52201:1630-2412(-)
MVWCLLVRTSRGCGWTRRCWPPGSRRSGMGQWRVSRRSWKCRRPRQSRRSSLPRFGRLKPSRRNPPRVNSSASKRRRSSMAPCRIPSKLPSHAGRSWRRRSPRARRTWRSCKERSRTSRLSWQPRTTTERGRWSCSGGGTTAPPRTPPPLCASWREILRCSSSGPRRRCWLGRRLVGSWRSCGVSISRQRMLTRKRLRHWRRSDWDVLRSKTSVGRGSWRSRQQLRLGSWSAASWGPPSTASTSGGVRTRPGWSRRPALP